MFVHEIEKTSLSLMQNGNIVTFAVVKKNIRILDIAEKAGVSIGTVDRVLHERGEVSLETKDKILKIIEEFNFRPNIYASSLASKKVTTFASLIPMASGDDEYWSRPIKGIEKATNQLRQFGVVMSRYFFKMEDPRSFTTEAEKILEISPEAIILAPWFKREALDFTKVLDQRKIPYVFIDSNLEEANPVCFIAQDSRQSGFLAAKLLEYGIQENGIILLVHITRELENAYHLLQREKGFLHFFKSVKKPHQITCLEVTGGDSEIVDKLGKLGISLDQVDAVFVTNSRVHSVAKYFSSLEKIPRIVGYDLIKSNVDLLRQGKIDFLLCQKPEYQGYMAANLLFDYMVRKEKVKMENYTSIDIITKENIEYYSSF